MKLSDLLPDFVFPPSQPFLMGTPERELSMLAKTYGGTRESYREESPQHRLCLPPFAIADTPVTNALYAIYVTDTGARPPLIWRGATPPNHLRNCPVTDVSWEDARHFCRWLSNLMATPYRLPTEAEWEYAARGSDGRRFPWGNEWDPTRANTRDGGPGIVTPVGSYPSGASPWGCLDMAGNVWEWTASLDAPYPYRSDDGREDPNAPGRRILRGGSFANPHGFARCACRFRLAPTVRNEFLGFRLAFSTAS
ncbi:MAG: SUMF1/EgtB/PvdO family nonheme iron enzyme [Roseiflexus sp.]|jgi:formylglycine-generating enzyme required for sulfatase activity|nr:SUMF1/EgtB/PvdO family nonheme iron enzyme [Roseiflexus sp.]MBO9383695.1 SUMF1/EgtB/PvdO family nonheme iron enzyme [Roseiflexus sp.]MBO9387588.1 SUMF1/EgtB/PvdO family nonheme iron enzyme [Roseiflexus sp.]